MSQQTEVDLPIATLRPIRGRSWAWLLPLLALVAVFWIGDRAWRERGPSLWLHAQHGQGMQPGSLLRYRGIAVGEVVAVELKQDLKGVLLELRLEPGAEALARVGSRFWVVRPNVSLDRLSGLETILGARHLTVIPGPEDAQPQHEFICLEEAPLSFADGEVGVEFLLEAPRRLGLAPGAPITYRDMLVGTILSVALASDATQVEVRAMVRKAYVQLVREDSRFWETSGLEFNAGILGGVQLNLKSLRSLIVGGIAMATPTEPGPLIRTGHRFTLELSPKPAWLEWSPALPLGSELLPLGTPRVDLQRARLVWEEGMFSRDKESNAWVLPMPGFVVGPHSVLVPGEDAEGPALEVHGKRLELSGAADAEANGLARRNLVWNDLAAWPLSRIRDPGAPEDVIAVVDSNRAPIAVTASRLGPLVIDELELPGWSVDPAIPFSADWNGAAVLARRDGQLLGLLLVEERGVSVRPLLELCQAD